MAVKSQPIQDPYLNAIRRENIPVSVYLVNGVKLQGKIDAFDQFVIMLKSGSSIQLVYKHAISTIMASREPETFQKELPQAAQED